MNTISCLVKAAMVITGLERLLWKESRGHTCGPSNQVEEAKCFEGVAEKN